MIMIGFTCTFIEWKRNSKDFSLFSCCAVFVDVAFAVPDAATSIVADAVSVSGAARASEQAVEVASEQAVEVARQEGIEEGMHTQMDIRQNPYEDFEEIQEKK